MFLPFLKDLPDCVANMPESHSYGNVNTLDEQLRALKSRHHRQQITLDLIPPPKAVAPNPVPCHSVVGFSKRNSQKNVKIPPKWWRQL
jgi:hypothetical protein